METASLSASETNGEFVLSQSFSTAWQNLLEKKGSGLTSLIREIALGHGVVRLLSGLILPLFGAG